MAGTLSRELAEGVGVLEQIDEVGEGATGGGAVEDAMVERQADRARGPGLDAAAAGDEGARPWLRAHPELVVHVDCTDVGTPDDVDTPQDLAALAARSHPHAREAAR